MSDKSKNYISYILLALSIISIGVITCSSYYSILTADDFSHAYQVGVSHVGFISYFKASIDYSILEYNNWQGTYFSMFLQALLSPANNGGLIQLSIEMIVSNILLFGTLALLIFKGFKFRDNDLFIKSIVYFLIVIELTWFLTKYREIYYWFSGATSYAYPLELCLIGLTLNLNYIKDNKVKYLIFSLLCGICSGGGSLTIAAFGCYTTLVIFIYDYLNKKKINKGNIVIFIVWVLAALINTLGPGNYHRAGVDAGKSLSLFKAFTGSVLMVLIRSKAVLLQSAIVFVLFIVILVGSYFGNKDNINNRLITSLLYALVSFVVAFPVCLATGGPNTSSRLSFITDFSIYLSAIYLAYTLGCLIKDKAYIKYIKYASIVVLLITIIFIKPTNIITTTSNLIDGTYSNYHSVYKVFLDGLDDKEGQDVIVKKEDYPKDIECFMNFELDKDPTYWINEGIANFYNLKSIRVEE